MLFQDKIMAHFNIKVQYDGFDDNYVIYNSIHHMTISENYNDIVFIDMSDNDIYLLPKLPKNLQVLICCNCKLSRIKKLPDSLSFLNCSNNYLTSICELPSHLKTFGCAHNNLCSMPTLPSGLQSFWCNHNQLKILDYLPNSLEFLHCHNNPDLKRLPPLPYNLNMDNFSF